MSGSNGVDQGAPRVLLAESEPRVAATTRHLLEEESFEVTVSAGCERALELARDLPAEYVVLCTALPELGGVETCRRLREFSDAYVILLAARDSEADRLAGLSAGADDCIAKPFYPRELVARIRAMQRRPRNLAGRPRVHRRGDLEIDAAARRVSVGGAEVGLSRIEFDLLEALASNPRASLSRRQLLESVWGPAWFGDDHAIDVHVSKLRRKLGNRSYVETVRGFGYRIGRG